jgi:excisionase family DNA binding protein
MPSKSPIKPDLIGPDADRLLSPAEKARQLGISADTLRRWENEGRIESTRTAGGQRRYREDAAPHAARRKPASHPRESDEDSLRSDLPRRETVQVPAFPHWQERIEERRADLEIAKLDREHRALLRAEVQDREERKRHREDEERRLATERQRQAAEQRESQRLEGLVQRGMLLAMLAPMDLQALARRELLAFVTSEHFPERMTVSETDALLKARVEQVLRPWRDRQRVDGLLREASTHASWKTLGSDWDVSAAQEARREVELRLKREVDPSWTKGDVQARVDEILEEWE